MKASKKSICTNLIVVLTLLGSLIPPALAEEEGMTAEDDIWTQIGIYGLFLGIEGDARLNRVTSDVDVSWDDIWDNLDIGGMGFVEHRRERWSFIGDAAYLKLEADRTVASNVL